MDAATRTLMDNIYSTDRPLQTQAYFALIEATNQPVDWAYEVWEQLVKDLKHKDNHVRSIAAQLLYNLAKSDPEQRILRDFEALLAVTRDNRGVTARHSLQAMWKIGVVGKAQQARLVEGLEQRFHEAGTAKYGSLTRYDIAQSLRSVYDVVQDDSIRAKALELIETETDVKYRKKYATVWRSAK